MYLRLNGEGDLFLAKLPVEESDDIDATDAEELLLWPLLMLFDEETGLSPRGETLRGEALRIGVGVGMRLRFGVGLRELELCCCLEEAAAVGGRRRGLV